MIQSRWDRIKHKVVVDQDTGCHTWTGGTNASGHGVIMVKGKRMYVHRIVYQLTYGRLWTNHDVRHKCHNPACVNPKHLQCLTRREHANEHVMPDSLAPAMCKRGHAGHYNKNTQGKWTCSRCKVEADIRYYEKKNGPRGYTFKKAV